MPSHATPEPAGRNGPLAGVRVLDLTRLAPGPYCTMLLADMGADVIVVGGGRAGLPVPELCRGKRFMSLDLKSEAGQRAFLRLAASADVLLEGFRPGVMGRMGADDATLRRANPRLIYCALTGYGQAGPRAQEAGHDINYLAVSGVLGAVGPADRPPYPPLNLLADFGGGGLLAAFGIVSALFERARSGLGQFVDAAMIDGCLSMMAMHFPLWRTPLMEGRGHGIVTGDAPFYRCYPCSDGRHVSVGALERGFFEALWTGLELGEVPDHMHKANWPMIEQRLGAAFRTRSRDEWSQRFRGSNACVAPVLEPHEVWEEEQIKTRLEPGGRQQVPAIPKFLRTPASAAPTNTRDQTREILAEAGFSPGEISAIGGTHQPRGVKGLVWPPALT